ncbi:Tumor necrosis factor receptor superfamily member 21 [Varanus komodoensis]|nr:Tumor necrosis factor receptor superfamily member 21 [Varanus komodoensis]
MGAFAAKAAGAVAAAAAAAAAFPSPLRGAAIVSSLLVGFMFLGTIDARSELTSEQNAISLSFGTYSHLDPATNIELTCDKCPAGAYVSKHCTMTSLRECSHCASGTFTKHENGIESCHLCRKPCEPPMVERIRCTALTDRECACPSGSFLDGKTCTPYSVCPIGWGVRKKGSETEDVKCKPCPRGTFSDVPSSVLRCKMFTNCTQNNLTLLIRGTKERDNICGFQSTTFPPKGVNSSASSFAATPPPSTYADIVEPTDTYNRTSKNEIVPVNVTAVEYPKPLNHQQIYYHKHTPSIVKIQPALEMSSSAKSSIPYKPPKRGSPRQTTHKHFDINEHLPWMIVLLLLLVLVVIVVCSVRKSSRTLKKGPRQDPSAIVEKSILKKSSTTTQNREKWICYCNGHVRIQGKPFNITVVQVYAPTTGAEEAEVDRFYEGLQHLLEITPKNDVRIIVGDWNAKVGSQKITRITGKFGDGVQNEAGHRLVEFCQENMMVIANTLFQQSKRRLYTWTSTDGQHSNQLDYVLCSQRWRSSIQSVKTRPGTDCSSDRELLVAKFRLKLNKVWKSTKPLRYLTEADKIKKRWQDYIEELYKKELNVPDNHVGLVTDLEPDIKKTKLMVPGPITSWRIDGEEVEVKGIDILKLVAAQVGSQWKDIYQFLCDASEREVAAFANGYSADHEMAYAALQHWTIRGPEASLAQLISALRQHRRTDVVEKIRGLMEDTTQVMPDCVSVGG